MISERQHQPPPKCIFCGGGGVRGNRMTGEHLWSDWMKPLFPQWPRAEYSEFWETYAGKERVLSRHIGRSRQGAPHRKKIKTVCRNCNTGWMSGLETSVKPFLPTLIKGEPCSLTAENRTTLATWVSLKVLVSEHNDYCDIKADPIFDQPVRDLFKKRPAVPTGFKIWIVPQQGGMSWILGYRRHAAGLLWGSSPPDYVGSPKNIQSVTFGIGKLLVCVLATTNSQVYDLLDLAGPTVPICLWPFTESDIIWPGTFAVTDVGADQLALVLDALIASPHVRWAPPRIT